MDTSDSVPVDTIIETLFISFRASYVHTYNNLKELTGSTSYSNVQMLEMAFISMTSIEWAVANSLAEKDIHIATIIREKFRDKVLNELGKDFDSSTRESVVNLYYARFDQYSGIQAEGNEIGDSVARIFCENCFEDDDGGIGFSWYVPLKFFVSDIFLALLIKTQKMLNSVHLKYRITQ